MGTRSIIYVALKKELCPQEQIYAGVYCSLNGFLEGVGAALHNFYNSPKRALSLIRHGHIVYLGATIKESTFFHSLRSKKRQAIFETVSQLPQDTQMINFVYIYFQEGDKKGWHAYKPIYSRRKSYLKYIGALKDLKKCQL